MKIRKRTDKKIFYLYLVTVAICIIMAFFLFSKYDNSSNQKEYLSYMNDWYDLEGNNVNIKNIKNDIIIKKQIGDILKDSQLLINVKDLNIDVIINDELIYSTNKFNDYYGKTPGVYFINIDLLREYSNQDITLKINFPYQSGAGRITDMKIGNYGDMTLSYLSLKYLNSCVCFVIIILGFVMGISFIPLFKKKIVGAEYLYLGIFSFNMGIFMLTDGKVLQYIFKNEAIFHTVAQLWMFLILTPLILFMDRIYNEKNKKTPYLICILSLIIFLVVFILNIFQIKDFHETIFLTHITYIIGAIYLFYVVLKNLFIKEDKKIFYAIGIFCFGLGSIIDIAVLYFGSTLETSLFTRFGVLAFLFFEIVGILNTNLKDYKKEVKTELLSRLAYHDGLTGVFNNYSFLEDMEYLEMEKNNIIIVMFDVNNLKKVNDKYGHTYGNDLIIEVATSIKENFEDIGKIYRIGGDEFSVLIRGKNNEEKVVELLDKVDQELAKKVNKYPFEISVASGYALYDSKKHTSLKDVFETADGRMYEKKKQMKNL